jgi:hypothetical protein
MILLVTVLVLGFTLLLIAVLTLVVLGAVRLFERLR